MHLTEAEFEELDAFLLSEDSPEECMDISMVDGFFAALAIRPDLIRPNVWLPEVLGHEQDGVFGDALQASQIVSLLVRYYNEVVWHLREAAEEFEPMFYTSELDGKTNQIVDEWCVGFVRGLRLENSAWTRWLQDPELKELIGPFLLFGTPAGWKKLEKLELEEQIHEETVAQLMPCLAALSQKWRSEVRAPTTSSPQARVGRNNLCPCGSGQKYKRCCGLN